MTISSVELKARAYDAIMAFFERNDVRLSESQVDRIVGGKRHRERLIALNKLKDIKKGSSPHSPWRYNAAEVYANVRTYNK